MKRSAILGLGSYVPTRVVSNEELRFLDARHQRQAAPTIDTSDEWIVQRTGIKERRYVPNDATVITSDLALWAAQRALEDAKCDATEIDCIILGTLSPDVHFPGTGVFLQQKLGLAGRTNCACYDIRQQCSAFIYGLQMADSFIRSGTYQRVLVIGAELQSHSLDYSTRGRDVTVLFGDGAGAVVVGSLETDDPRAGILYTAVHADGGGAWDLHLKIFETQKLPYVDYDARDPAQNRPMYPSMEGKRVFLNAVKSMAASAHHALRATGLTWADVDWFVPHQANQRISDKVVEVAEVPLDKALSSIEWYGNTTAASVPLTLDHWRQLGRVKKGDLVLSTVFGSGFTWGAAIFRI